MYVYVSGVIMGFKHACEQRFLKTPLADPPKFRESSVEATIQWAGLLCYFIAHSQQWAGRILACTLALQAILSAQMTGRLSPPLLRFDGRVALITGAGGGKS